MKTKEQIKEYLSKGNYNFNTMLRILRYLNQYDLLKGEINFRCKSDSSKPYDDFNAFVDWFESKPFGTPIWSSCEKLIEMYENIATDILHKEVTNAFNESIDFNDIWSKIKEEEERTENVFIKNKDGKLYKYQGGIRRELEQELVDRITLFDFISSLSIKNKDNNYIYYLREKIEEINNKLFELDEE